MHRRGNKPAGTAARLITFLIVGVSIAIVAIMIYAVQRTRPTTGGDQVMPGQAAEKLGQVKPSAAIPR